MVDFRKHIDKCNVPKKHKHVELQCVVLQRHAARSVFWRNNAASILHESFFISTCTLFMTYEYISETSLRARRFKRWLWQPIKVLPNLRANPQLTFALPAINAEMFCSVFAKRRNKNSRKSTCPTASCDASFLSRDNLRRSSPCPIIIFAE